MYIRPLVPAAADDRFPLYWDSRFSNDPGPACMEFYVFGVDSFIDIGHVKVYPIILAKVSEVRYGRHVEDGPKCW